MTFQDNCTLRSVNISSFPIVTREQYRQTPAGGRFLYLFMRHPRTILFGCQTSGHSLVNETVNEQNAKMTVIGQNVRRLVHQKVVKFANKKPLF